MSRVSYIVLICFLLFYVLPEFLRLGLFRAHGSRGGEGQGEAMLSISEGLMLLHIRVESNSVRREC